MLDFVIDCFAVVGALTVASLIAAWIDSWKESGAKDD